MCGRFGASFQYRDIKIVWNLYGDFLGFFPRYNIASSQDVPVIVRNDGRNELRSMRWGLVPSWSQDHSIGQRMINARAETLLEKPSFKQLVATRRCLVPADGFYEWRREATARCRSGSISRAANRLRFLGCGTVGSTATPGSPLYTFTIITTRANGLVQRIHYRIPVIYDAAMGRQWLDGRFGARAMALDLVLQPLPSEPMEAHEVSTLVNSPDNDSPESIHPLSDKSLWMSRNVPRKAAK
jgi:putative SOS response-associated peptidase YedK